MHIPDGYISPASAAVLYGAAVPFWWRASRVLRKQLAGQTTPALAVLAALAFTIQMFNVPVPGGTTAHAVGGTLIAIVLGPWAAVVGVSVVMILQAVFFGDGGITAIGANCFNMAVALPFTGYWVYRLVAGDSPVNSRRRVVAAAVGSYVGINVAGLLVGAQLGIQPMLWSENGRALYSPYGLEVAIPAVMLAQLTVAGLAEMLVTGLVVAYLQRAQPELLAAREPAVSATRAAAGAAGRGWVVVAALGLLILLTPLGLLATGDAWGEWAPETVEELVGYVPAGLAELGGISALAPVPDYQLPMVPADASFVDQAIGYVLSAVIGVALTFVVVFGLRLLLVQRESRPGAGEAT